MKKYAVQEKSRGVVLFAFNTKIDYVEIARRSAKIIHKILALPVTLVTDTEINSPEFDQVILVDNTLENYKVGQPGSWRNGDRYRAYELSPYDETLLIDSDCLTLDTNLLTLFEQDFDYRIMTDCHTLDHGPWGTSMGTYSLPFQWATIVMFKRTEKSKMLFDLVGRVQRNYGYYLKLYHINYSSFRNDYAFTIANNMLNGYSLNMDQGIPWSVLTLNNPVKSIGLANNLMTIKEKDKAYVIPQQTLHILDKEYLLTDNFANFVDLICLQD